MSGGAYSSWTVAPPKTWDKLVEKIGLKDRMPDDQEVDE